MGRWIHHAWKDHTAICFLLLISAQGHKQWQHILTKKTIHVAICLGLAGILNLYIYMISSFANPKNMMKHAHYIYYNIYCMSKHADMMEHVQFQSINMMMVIRELAYKIAENKIFKYIFKLLYHSETAISTHPSVLACIIWGRQCLIFQLLLQPHERCEVTVWTPGRGLKFKIHLEY